MKRNGPLLETRSSVRSTAAPYAMVRMAGLPMDGLLAMNAARTIEALERAAELRSKLGARRISLQDAVAGEVARVMDDTLRRLLIQYKRDLYNGRRPKRIADQWTPYLSPALAAAMRELESLDQTLVWEEQAARNHFNEEEESCRERLQQLAGEPNLLNGLLLTSPELFSKVRKYAATPLSEHNSRLRKVEYSLLTVLSRVVAKTSPFSTFTPVGLGEWSASASDAGVQGAGAASKSAVKINYANVLRVWNGLLHHPDIITALRCRLNPSLKLDRNTERCSLIRRTDDSHKRVKVYQTLETPVSFHCSPMVLHVVDALKSGPMYYEELLDRLLEVSGVSERKEIGRFVKQLLELQVVLPENQLCEQSADIIGDILTVLEDWPQEIAGFARERLQEIRQAVRSYEKSADFAERAKLLNEIGTTFRCLNETIGCGISDKSLALLIYEDAVLDKPGRLPDSAWSAALDDLAALQQVAPVFDVKFRLQSVIAQLFVEQYGKHGVCTDTGQFVRQLIPVIWEFLRAMIPGELFADLEVRNDNPSVSELNRLKREFGEWLSDLLMTDQEEVELDRKVLARFAERIPEPIRNRPLSHDFFLQWARNGQGDRFIVNQAYFGYLTFFSRFLEHADDTELESLRRYLQQVFGGGSAIAEISGVYGFNANLHPPLAPYELEFPALAPGRPPQETVGTVRWESLQLRYDEATERVVLDHPELGRLNALFLSSLIPMLIPNIVSLLMNNFSNAPLPDNWFRFAEEKLTDAQRDTIRCYPRLTIGSVVLQRRKWLVPRGRLPLRQPQENDFDYFCRLREWKKELNLPDKVFFRFMPMHDGENPILQRLNAGAGSAEELPDIDFTELKPQYMDFDNPMCAKLFGKMTAAGTLGIGLEEMMPGPEELTLYADGRAYVSEFVVELSRYAEKE
ncbi:lantibiotic dehydratase [Paenibacillus tarimensis]